MRVALASDVHLEFEDLDIQNTDNADVLILAGDIMIVNDLHDHPEPAIPHTPELIKLLGSRQRKAHEYRQFLKRCSERFPHVIMIAGNHEFYHGRWISNLETLRTECSKFANVSFFEDDYKIINDYVFVGATLWTDMARGDPLVTETIRNGMNDYHVIRHDGDNFIKLHPRHSIARHKNSLKYFAHVLSSNPDRKCVVISHHAPSSLSIHDQYRSAGVMNRAYYSDLSDFVLDNPQIKLWCHGHVHTGFDYEIGQCRVVCNPRGYVNHERGNQQDDPYYPLILDI